MPMPPATYHRGMCVCAHCHWRVCAALSAWYLRGTAHLAFGAFDIFLRIIQISLLFTILDCEIINDRWYP